MNNLKRHRRALVLNADYTAIGLVNWQQAIKQEVGETVNVIDFYADDKILCVGGTYRPVVAVAVLREYKKKGKLTVPYSRKNVFIRDRLTCQYCHKQFHWRQLTLDHVVPRCKVGENPTRWNNIVTCCHACNFRKADKLVNKTDMRLLSDPVQPDPFGFVIGLSPWTTLQPEWLTYLPNFYLDLLEVEER